MRLSQRHALATTSISGQKTRLPHPTGTIRPLKLRRSSKLLSVSIELIHVFVGILSVNKINVGTGVFQWSGGVADLHRWTYLLS